MCKNGSWNIYLLNEYWLYTYSKQIEGLEKEGVGEGGKFAKKRQF